MQEDGDETKVLEPAAGIMLPRLDSDYWPYGRLGRLARNPVTPFRAQVDNTL